MFNLHPIKIYILRVYVDVYDMFYVLAALGTDWLLNHPWEITTNCGAVTNTMPPPL